MDDWKLQCKLSISEDEIHEQLRRDSLDIGKLIGICCEYLSLATRASKRLPDLTEQLEKLKRDFDIVKYDLYTCGKEGKNCTTCDFEVGGDICKKRREIKPDECWIWRGLEKARKDSVYERNKENLVDKYNDIPSANPIVPNELETALKKVEKTKVNSKGEFSMANYAQELKDSDSYLRSLEYVQAIEKLKDSTKQI